MTCKWLNKNYSLKEKSPGLSVCDVVVVFVFLVVLVTFLVVVVTFLVVVVVADVTVSSFKQKIKIS